MASSHRKPGLVLSRNTGEEIEITVPASVDDTKITVQVDRVSYNRVRLRTLAPHMVKILRTELADEPRAA